MTPLPQPSAPGVLSRPWVRIPCYILIAYVGLVSMLLFLENWLVYQPTRFEQHWQPPPSPDIEDVHLASADGTRIHAWWCPAKDSDTALLYCHGNAGNLSHRGNSMVKLRNLLNVSVLIVDYPGYGKSEGSPTEQGCYAAAGLCYDWLIDKKNFPAKKIILYGGSLGGGVVTDLASRKEHRALVLIKTFSSLPDVASDLYWWLPAPKQWLMSNRMESIRKIGSIHQPVFIAHGTTDSLIPYAHGERLFAAANEPKRFFKMPGHDHNMPLPDEMFVDLKDFLDKNPVK
ncbi:MAG: alpha/beta hydrolase [Planctomycetes bacterium]|nr:alpha/beta hydrolase [Planctomycetota bacterium]